MQSLKHAGSAITPLEFWFCYVFFVCLDEFNLVQLCFVMLLNVNFIVEWSLQERSINLETQHKTTYQTNPQLHAQLALMIAYVCTFFVSASRPAGQALTGQVGVDLRTLPKCTKKCSEQNVPNTRRRARFTSLKIYLANVQITSPRQRYTRFLRCVFHANIAVFQDNFFLVYT